MKENNTIEKNLLRIKEILECKDLLQNSCAELEEIVAVDLPAEICCILKNSEEVNDLANNSGFDFFEGMPVSSYAQLLEEYTNREGEYTFFTMWGVDEDYNIKGFHTRDEDGNVYKTFNHHLDYDLYKRLDEPVVIESVKNHLPMFSDNGDYLLYNVTPKSDYKGLLLAPVQHHAELIAPSLIAHIDDLLDGFQNGRYFYDADREVLIYPSNWYYRKQLKNGNYSMDSKGRLIDIV